MCISIINKVLQEDEIWWLVLINHNEKSGINAEEQLDSTPTQYHYPQNFCLKTQGLNDLIVCRRSDSVIIEADVFNTI